MRARERKGYRGYIASRPIAGQRIPQHVQNLVVRDFAARRGHRFLLSATEYARPDCFVVLEGLLNELETIEGVIFYSLFQLPSDARRRQRFYGKVLAADAVIYAAVEDYRLAGTDDVAQFEDLLRISAVLAQCPTELT